MCIRYVPIYQCNHRERRPQPELFLCSRALAAFAYQAKTAPLISTTNGTFVVQKLASRTAGCLQTSTTELDLFYQVAPGWCDACLANGRAMSCRAFLESDMLTFKREDVGQCFPWMEGVVVPRRCYTEAQRRVWVGGAWFVEPVEHDPAEGVECTEGLNDLKRAKVAEKKGCDEGEDRAL